VVVLWIRTSVRHDTRLEQDDTPQLDGLMSPANDPAEPGTDLPEFAETILATTRYLAAIEPLTDDEMRAPTALPGWTRGHVVTHLSRHADALAGVLKAAVAGEVGSMYDSQERRSADIQAGAHRPAAELIEDAAASWGRLLQADNELDVVHLAGSFTRTPGTDPLPLRDIGRMRRTEVEIHHADLLLDYRPTQWPADFSRGLISRRQAELADGPSMVLAATDVEGLWKFGPGQGPEIRGALGDLAWWLVGRGGGPGLVSSTGALPHLDRWR
jgi:maleylpyruvate isomerase